jgi:hypothetical protein
VSAYLAAWTKQYPTDVEESDDRNLPNEFMFVQNYPNPFNPSTTIEYSVPSRSEVTIEIFNTVGQKVRTLLRETKSAGKYSAVWDGRDNNGNSLSTGVYFYRIQAGDYEKTKKMILVK